MALRLQVSGEINVGKANLPNLGFRLASLQRTRGSWMEHLRDKQLSPATPHLYIMASLSEVGKTLDLCTISPNPTPDTPPLLCSQLQHSGLKLCPWTGASSYLGCCGGGWGQACLPSGGLGASAGRPGCRTILVAEAVGVVLLITGLEVIGSCCPGSYVAPWDGPAAWTCGDHVIRP